MTNRTEHILADLTSYDQIIELMLTTHRDIHDYLELNNLVDMWRRRTAFIFEHIYRKEKYFNVDLSDYVPEVINTVTEFDRIRLLWAVDRYHGFPDGAWYAFEQWPTPQLQLPAFTTNTGESYDINLNLEFYPVCGTSSRHHSTFNYDHDHNTGLIRGYICRECNVDEARSYAPVPQYYRELIIAAHTPPNVDNFWIPWRTGHDHYMSQNIYEFYERVTRNKACSVGGRIHNTLLSRLHGDTAQANALFTRILPRLRLKEGKLTEFNEDTHYDAYLASMIADDPSYISYQEIRDLIDTAMTSLTHEKDL